MTGPTAWNDGTAPADDAEQETPETPELFEQPPHWDSLTEEEQELWRTKDFFQMKRGLSSHCNPDSENFEEQITMHLATGLMNSRVLEGAARLLAAQAKASMGAASFLGLLGRALGIKSSYDKVEVGGLMFASAVVQDQDDHCIELCRMIRLWGAGILGPEAKERITTNAVEASRLFDENKSNFDFEDEGSPEEES